METQARNCSDYSNASKRYHHDESWIHSVVASGETDPQHPYPMKPPKIRRPFAELNTRLGFSGIRNTKTPIVNANGAIGAAMMVCIPKACNAPSTIATMAQTQTTNATRMFSASGFWVALTAAHGWRTVPVTEDGRLSIHSCNRASRPSVHGMVTRDYRFGLTAATG